MTSDAVVLRETVGTVERIQVNRPDKLNALNLAVIAALKAELRRAAENPESRAIVISSVGDRAFVAGADIAEMAALTPADARAFSRSGQALAEAIDNAGKPVIAAVQGFALGGGCELALMCHLRVAGPKAQFGQPEVGLGLIPGFGGTQRLARLVGEGRALDLILSTRRIDAETALAWGLVDRLARERSALDEAQALAEEIARQSPAAVRLALDAVRGGLALPLEEALHYEAALFGLGFSTADMREGTAAFLEKRKPQFSGR